MYNMKKNNLKKKIFKILMINKSKFNKLFTPYKFLKYQIKKLCYIDFIIL